MRSSSSQEMLVSGSVSTSSYLRRLQCLVQVAMYRSHWLFPRELEMYRNPIPTSSTQCREPWVWPDKCCPDARRVVVRVLAPRTISSIISYGAPASEIEISSWRTSRLLGRPATCFFVVQMQKLRDHQVDDRSWPGQGSDCGLRAASS